MRQGPFVCAAILISSLCWTFPLEQKTPEEIAAEFSDSIVLIGRELPAGGLGLGTGFFLTPDIVATNFHVVEGSDKVYLKLSDGTILSSDTLFAFDEEKDLALIKLPERHAIEPVALGRSASVKQGQDVVVISNPRGILENTVSNGLISAIRQLPTHTLFQISAPISRGSSGGPVFNSDGAVVAVVVGTIEEGQNLNFAVPVSYLKELLLELHETKLSELPRTPQREEESSSEPMMDGSWVATFADSLGSGKLYFNLVQLGDGRVTGTYTSSLGGGGTVKGTRLDNELEFELQQSNVDCPGIYKGRALVDGDRGFGTYTGYTCFGSHENGTVTLSRSDTAPPSPTGLPQESFQKPRPCPIAVSLVGVYLNDGTRGAGWLSKNMKNWWDKEGRQKHAHVCFVDDESNADYRLEWSWSDYSVPTYNTQTGAVGYWGHTDVRVTVYRPNSQQLLFTKSHHGRWRWSKPDKDALKAAIEFIAKLASEN